MQIIYPTEYVVLENGCIAVWRKKSGPRKVAGIITEEHRANKRAAWTPECKAELAKKMLGNKIRSAYLASRKNNSEQA